MYWHPVSKKFAKQNLLLSYVSWIITCMVWYPWGLYLTGVPNNFLPLMKAFLMYKFTKIKCIYSVSKKLCTTILFLLIPAPKLWLSSNGSSIAIQGEIHIFSNLVRFLDCRMETTSLLSSQTREKKSRKPIQSSPTDHLFLPQPFHDPITLLL